MRLQRCGASAPLTPLYYSTKLAQAAQRYSHGASLQNAIASAGYLAAQSAAIHLSGTTSDAQTESMLVARQCRTLQDPSIREFGAEQRGRDIWMVLAAPVSLPARGDAPAVSRTILDLVNAARAAGRRCGAKYFAPVRSAGARSSTDARGGGALTRYGGP